VFLQGAINNPYLSEQLLSSWFQQFSLNASDKPTDTESLFLEKKEVISPVIAIVLNSAVTEDDFNKVSDYDNYFEVHKEFCNVINRYVYDYELAASISGDYISKRKKILNNSLEMKNYRYNYVKENWIYFENKFMAIPDPETREAVVKLLMVSIISNRSKIKNICEAFNYDY
jgi:hypothetical protein